MQVTAAQVRKSVNAKYLLWDGEMIVRVIQHTGAYGFHSAAVIVDRIDCPLEVTTSDWYDNKYSSLEHQGKEKGTQAMLEWIASELTRLSTGVLDNEGGVGTVEGLKG
jgi:hypothetical protein